jgi:hypothetical protein
MKDDETSAQSGDWADRLAGHVLGTHCACYAEAWPASTCDTERFNCAVLIRSFFAANGLAVVPREPTVGMVEAAIRSLRLTKSATEEAVKLARLVGGPHEPGCAVTIRAAIAAGEKEIAP